MRHGRKSASRKFDGYKMDVMTDEASELVLGVEIRSGNAGDGEGAAPLLEQVQAVDGIEVETLLGDMAYSDGDTRVAVEELGTELVAKVPPVTNRGLFPKTDFVIDLEASTATCPPGAPPPMPVPAPITRAGPPCCSSSLPRSAPPARCGSAAPPPRRVAAASPPACTRPASLLLGRPGRPPRAKPFLRVPPKWSARLTIFKN